jgi:AraC-like DNA-binding protein
MSLPTNDLPAFYKTIIGDDFLDKPGNSLIRPDPMLMSRLRKLHKVVAQLAHDVHDLLERPEVCRAFEEQLIHAMVRCLAESVGFDSKVGARRHDVIIRRFEEFLEAHPDQPLYLTEICAAVGVAERTLRASCEEHLGMGPIRFLTLRRMHLVYQALLRADPSKSTVTGIVTDYGFWELGRFSVAYRTFFGESPSATLRRSREIAPPTPAPQLSYRKAESFHPNY